MKATVSQNLVNTLLHYASSLGVDPSEACAAANLPFPVEMISGARIPAGQFYALWMEITQHTNDPDFGLHFAALSYSHPRRDILTAVMFNCPTVGEAMETLSRYHDLATDFIKIHISEQDGNVHYSWETPSEGPLNRHISEAVISWLFFTLKELASQPIPIRKVCFRHQGANFTSEHQQTFKCTIAFDQTRDEIIVAREVLEFPIPLADPSVIQHLEGILQEQLNELYPPNTWSERVTHFISQMFLRGDQPSIGTAAKEVSLSTRQLQNKLKDEGASYRKLLDQVRKEMALRYLKEPNVNLYDIAFLLGFSDQSAFNHAFKRWTGTSPRKYQK